MLMPDDLKLSGQRKQRVEARFVSTLPFGDFVSNEECA
jgi:hypothetical protein